MTDEEKKAKRAKDKIAAARRSDERKIAAGFTRMKFWATDEEFQLAKQFLEDLRKQAAAGV